MPYDNLPIHSDEWKATIEEMSVVMKEMAEEIVKLRAEIAPLMERHQLEEEQRRQSQALAEEKVRLRSALANQYAAQYANQVYGVCDCTPSRTQGLTGFFQRVKDLSVG